MNGIYWVRSDLRLFDNDALSACLTAGDSDPRREIIFVFPQTKSLGRAGPLRLKFIEECRSEYRRELLSQGFKVLTTDQLFSEFIASDQSHLSIDRLYFNREYAWEERQEEFQVERFCREHQIEIHGFDAGTLIARNDLPFSLDDMPFVFTDYRKKVEANLRIKSSVLGPHFGGKGTNLENKGLARLRHYLWGSDAVRTYKQTRNGMVRYDDSSKLSPWLNTGVLSARTVYQELKKYEAEVCKNDSTYWLFFELLWRDYFKFFSLKFGPRIFLAEGLRPGTSPNRKDSEVFQAWCEGRTADEFVNANMNELNETGWMSNRGRQNVASYLIHDLGVNWTWGAGYFERMLIDYDPDLNWGNWLYLSGRGSDPRARRFDTTAQAKMYDPDFSYRKLWARR
jgi:deoxyribodipyrimidine photo-lyase